MQEDWKGYLKLKGLWDNSPFALRKGMQALERKLTDRLPSVRGMLWLNNNINPQAKVADVNQALELLERFGVANFDALGPPSEDSRSNIFNNMFISQEDSKINETDPSKNQNSGNWNNPTPKKVRGPFEEKPVKKKDNIDLRMQKLIQLIEDVKKS